MPFILRASITSPKTYLTSIRTKSEHTLISTATMASSKPTVLFVPGAWHTPDCFDPVVQRLQKAGYEVDSVTLPSIGASDPPADFKPDVAEIRKHIEAIVEYGSVPASDAIKGLDVKSRSAAGKPGGVNHFFFLTAFVNPEGVSLLDTLGGQDLPWFDVSEDKRVVNPKNPNEVFYNDLTEEQLHSSLAKLKPFSYQMFNSKPTYAAWKDVPATYLYCTKDNAIPIFVQKNLVENVAKGYNFKTESVDASHSPFISVPDETAAAIRRAAGEAI